MAPASGRCISALVTTTAPTSATVLLPIIVSVAGLATILAVTFATVAVVDASIAPACICKTVADVVAAQRRTLSFATTTSSHLRRTR